MVEKESCQHRSDAGIASEFYLRCPALKTHQQHKEDIRDRYIGLACQWANYIRVTSTQSNHSSVWCWVDGELNRACYLGPSIQPHKTGYFEPANAPGPKKHPGSPEAACHSLKTRDKTRSKLLLWIPAQWIHQSLFQASDVGKGFLFNAQSVL